MSLADSDTASASDSDEEITELLISPLLRSCQPSLSRELVESIRQHAYDYTVHDAPPEGPFKSVMWRGYEGRAGLLWVDAREFLVYSSLNHLERLVCGFRRTYNLSIYSDTFMILFQSSHLTEAEVQRIQPFLDAVENHLNVTVLRVETMEEAAQTIVCATSELVAFVNDPKNERLELRNTYA
ncbi:hypothetical protein V5O48_016615, partial [Marasmius crinis-equi]